MIIAPRERDERDIGNKDQLFRAEGGLAMVNQHLPVLRLRRPSLATALIGLAGAVVLDGCQHDEAGIDQQEGSAQLTSRAVDALGGEAALRQLTSFSMSVSGTRSVPGQQWRPEESPPMTTSYDAQIRQDLVSGGARFDISRTVRFHGEETPQTFHIRVRNIGQSGTGPVGQVFGIENILGFPT